MKINELFDRPAPVTWRATNNLANAQGKVQGHDLEIQAYRADRQEDAWVVVFTVDDQLSLTGLAGTASQQIVSTVIHALTQWAKSQHPAWVSWTASTDEPSRISLYRKLRQKFSTGYVDVTNQPDIWPTEFQERHTVMEEQTVMVRSDVYKGLTQHQTEGKMKDLAYDISQGRPNPLVVPVKKPRASGHSAMISSLASRSGKSPNQVSAVWQHARNTHGDNWAQVMAATKRSLGI